jgi:hypothetical protein
MGKATRLSFSTCDVPMNALTGLTRDQIAARRLLNCYVETICDMAPPRRFEDAVRT